MPIPSKYDYPILVVDEQDRCDPCGGRGVCSEYDLGWHSLAHDPELATVKTCPICGGTGQK